jgi:iduronate 2-sulfatase
MNAKSTRREFLASMAGVSAASCIAGTLRAATRPNVLFILMEDLAPLFGCYGHDHVKTPNIDRLAAQSTLFERAYCQQALCSPSRISMFTGVRPECSGILDLKTPFRSVMPEVVTLPQLFKQNGYETIPVGKIFHISGDTTDPASWTADYFSSSTKYVLEASYKERERRIEKAKSRGETNFYGKAPVTECADVSDNEYDDGIMTEKAIEHLHMYRDKPFFLAMGYHRTHLPFTAPKKYWDMYKREDIKLVTDQLPPKNAPEPAYRAPTELRKFLGLPSDAPVPKQAQRETIHGYFACISYLDSLVGKLLDSLDELGLTDNTIVVLGADHGFHLGEHGMWAKKTVFENGVRVPLVVNVPGITKGKRTDSITEYVDLYPSLCELAGLSLPDHVSGTSFVPVLKDPESEPKKFAFSLYPRYAPDNREDKTIGYSVRSGRYRYNEWVHIPTDEVVGRELYDYETDPNERVNAVEEPGYSGVVDELSRVIKGHFGQYNKLR